MMYKICLYIRKILVVLVFVSLYISCKSGEKVMANKATSIEMLKDVANWDSYEFDIDVAYPFNTAATTQVLNAFLLQNTGNNANRIDVRGDGNFIRIKNDSVKGYLPFFGERRLNGGLPGGLDAAIQFDGVMENYTRTIDEDKGKLEVRFRTHQKQQKTETYDITVSVFANKGITVNVVPTYRTFMRYSGTLDTGLVEANSTE